MQLLGDRVDGLLSSYTPLTLSNITAQINQLNTQLLLAASLSQSSALDHTQLSRLELTLSLLSLNLTGLHQLLSELNTSLLESEANIRASAQFNGTVQLDTGELTNAEILMTELTALMDSIEGARQTASGALRAISAVNIDIHVSQATIDNSRERIAVYTNASVNILNQLTAIDATIVSFNSEYDRNRVSLSSLQQAGGEIARQQNESGSLISEGSSTAGATWNVTREAADLAREKEIRAADSLHSIEVALNNTEETASQSKSALAASLAVLNTSVQTADQANQTQYAQSDLLPLLDSLEQSCSNTGQLIRDTLSLTGPDPATAGLLSDSINRLIVPEETVSGIRQGANRSLSEAQLASETAMRARLAANNASNLLVQVVRDINLTQVTQTVTTNVSIENARNALLSAGEAVGEFYRETDQLIDTSDSIISLRRDVRQINRGLNEKFEESFQSAAVAEGECTGACGQGVSLQNMVLESVNNTEGLSGLLTEKEIAVSEVFQRLNALVNTTNNLLETVTSVGLEEIEGLLRELATEQQEIASIQREAEQLERDIAQVEENISSLVQLYQSCPQ